MALDFRRPVTPLHPLLCEVQLIRIGESSVRFSVRARQREEICFEGEFAEVFVKVAAHRKQAIPADFRSILEPLLAKRD
jgi:acyl-CoA thioesterase FadM